MRRFVGDVEPLDDLTVAICASTSALARDGHILEASGLDLSNYRRNPIVLWQHSPQDPVGVAESVAVRDGTLFARVRFAEPGISAVADQVRALVKSSIVKGVSIGFDPVEGEPLDPKRPRGGQRFTRAELLEISFCSIPADVGAGVTARSAAHSAAAIVRGLPRLPAAVIQRAAARIPQRRGGAILSPTMHTWAIAQQREREHLDSRAARQAAVDQLRRYADEHGYPAVAPHRRRHHRQAYWPK